MVLLGMDPALGRLGEPPVDEAAPQPGMPRLHAHERLGQRVLGERHAQVGGDLRRACELLEHAQQLRAGVVGPAGAYRRGVPSELEQVVALVRREAQRPRQRGDGLLGRPGAAALLQAGVEVGRHVRERGDLLAAQAAGRRRRRPAGRPTSPGSRASRRRLRKSARPSRSMCLEDRGGPARYPGTACPWIRRPLVAPRVPGARCELHDLDRGASMTTTTLPGGMLHDGR